MEKEQQEKIDERIQENIRLNSELVAEMLSFYRPALPDDEYVEYYTTEELHSMMARTLDFPPQDLARLLRRMGYHVMLMGMEWKWVMTRV